MRDNSVVKLKLQPSQTELLFRSVCRKNKFICFLLLSAFTMFA